MEVKLKEVNRVEKTLSLPSFVANLKKPVSVPYVNSTIKIEVYAIRLTTIPYSSAINTLVYKGTSNQFINRPIIVVKPYITVSPINFFSGFIFSILLLQVH